MFQTNFGPCRNTARCSSSVEIGAKKVLISAGVALSLVGVFFGRATRAEELDAYIMPMGTVTTQTSSVEKGTRYGGRVEFGRALKNVALDFRADSGLGYTDYGGMLKFFGNQKITSSGSIALILGGGLGMLYSTGYGADSVPTNTSVTVTAGQGFVDPFIGAFARLLIDTGWGFGLMFEAGVDVVPAREYLKKASLGVGNITDSEARIRPSFSIGIPFGV